MSLGKPPSEDTPPRPSGNFRPKKVPPLIWHESIKKVKEVDPLLCSHCSGLMKIVSFIYEYAVVKKILVHLCLYQVQEQKRGPPVVQPSKYTERVIEPYDDGWPEYEDTFIDLHARRPPAADCYCQKW